MPFAFGKNKEIVISAHELVCGLESVNLHLGRSTSLQKRVSQETADGSVRFHPSSGNA